MTPMIATVFGGTGFLGRHIAARLSHDGATVRLAVRNPEQAGRPPTPGPGEILPLRADVRDEAAVVAAVSGAGAVINAVGLYLEQGGATFQAVHVEGAERIARAAAAAGVPRLVHISGIGAEARSPSAYVRARAAGETAVRAAFEGATILRPSVLFGPGDAFFNTLAGLARASPVLPLFGRGDTRLQPVYVGDVAEAAARALTDATAPGRTFELGGPKTYSYRELLTLTLAQIDRRRLLLPLPFPLWHGLARVAVLLPSPPLTRDQVILMEQNNVVSPGAHGFAALGIEPTAAEAVLPSYVKPD